MQPAAVAKSSCGTSGWARSVLVPPGWSPACRSPSAFHQLASPSNAGGQFVMQPVGCGVAASRQGPYHQAVGGAEIADDPKRNVTQPTRHPRAGDRRTHRFVDHEADAGTVQIARILASVNDEVGLGCPDTALDGGTELSRPCHPVTSRQHVDRLTVQAVSERRPLRRRPVTIARPARVRIRKRKP